MSKALDEILRFAGPNKDKANFFVATLIYGNELLALGFLAICHAWYTEGESGQ